MGNFASSKIEFHTLQDDVNALQQQVKDMEQLKPLPFVNMEEMLIDKGILCHRYQCIPSASENE